MKPNEAKSAQRPKVGLALVGASTKAIFYVGFLEALQQERVAIDLIAATSSGAIVAAAYACGTLSELREFGLNLDRKLLSGYLERNRLKGGLYSMDKMEAEIRKLFTRGLRFEEVRPHLAFVAADLEKSEQVVLRMGDIARAVRISCTLPGIFQPVTWGNRTLIDGGLLNIIPADVARDMGMDIVIGVDMKGSRYIFGNQIINLRRAANFLKNVLHLRKAGSIAEKFERLVDESGLVNFFSLKGLNNWEERISQPGIFTVLGKSLDLSIQGRNNYLSNPGKYKCDILVSPEIRRAGILSGLADFSQSAKLYKLGREYGKRFAPKIMKLIEEKCKTP